MRRTVGDRKARNSNRIESGRLCDATRFHPVNITILVCQGRSLCPSIRITNYWRQATPRCPRVATRNYEPPLSYPIKPSFPTGVFSSPYILPLPFTLDLPSVNRCRERWRRLCDVWRFLLLFIRPSRLFSLSLPLSLSLSLFLVVARP